MAKTLHRQDFIQHLAKKHRRSQAHYQDALTEILNAVQEHLANGNKIAFTGFGTFYTRIKKGGKGLNFKTKEPLHYKNVRLAAFRPGDILKRAVKKKKGLFG
jgi:DNA-binding protein HU-beta